MSRWFYLIRLCLNEISQTYCNKAKSLVGATEKCQRNKKFVLSQRTPSKNKRPAILVWLETEISYTGRCFAEFSYRQSLDLASVVTVKNKNKAKSSNPSAVVYGTYQYKSPSAVQNQSLTTTDGHIHGSC